MIAVDWTAVLGGTSFALVVTSIVGWFKFVRKFSGDIEHSDADKLWKEAGAIRQDYRRQLTQLRLELKECKDLGEALQLRISDLETKLRGA